jgi:GABA(A) receptor-associated protein
MSLYKANISLDERKKVSSSLRHRYPDRVPIIVEVAKDSNLPPLVRTKYLVSADTPLGRIIYDIRQNMTLKPNQAVFIFISGTMQPVSALLGDIYEKHKDEDGFLYLTLHPENTFG